MPELMIQPIFATPIAFKTIDIPDSLDECIKGLKFKKIEDEGTREFGYQSEDTDLLRNIPTLEKTITKEVQDFNDKVMNHITPIKLTRSWATKFTPGEEGEIHIHQNSSYSFVLYLDSGSSIQFQKWTNDELWKPKSKSYNIFNMTSYDVSIEKGKLVIFLSSTPHKILKVKGDKDRYSIAGNYIITDLGDFKIV